MISTEFHWNNNSKKTRVYLKVWEREKRIHLLAHLLVWYLWRKFPHELTEKCLVIFDQSPNFCSSCGKECFYFSGNLLLRFLLWHDLKIEVKSRGTREYIFMSTVTYQQIAEVFFSVKSKCPIFHCLELDGRVLNLIYRTIRRKGQNLQNVRGPTPPRKYPKLSGNL